MQKINESFANKLFVKYFIIIRCFALTKYLYFYKNFHQNKTIILPNGAVSNGDITNYTREGKLRVDLTVGIAYESDIRKAKEVLMATMVNDEKILKDPEPFVGVSELADSSINLAVRPWATPEHYWDVYFGTLEACKIALDMAEVTIPFPQVDVHLDK